MFSVDNYEISQGTYGKKLTLHGEMTTEIQKVIAKKNVVELELNYAKGWQSDNDVSFLREMPFLKSLEIIDWRIQDISHIHSLFNLRSLKVMTDCKTAIDFSEFPELESAALEWRTKARSVYRCATLRDLFINGCTAKSLGEFAELTQLKSLSLKSPKLLEIGSVESMQKLAFLGIYNCRKITRLEGIGSFSGLNRLEVDTCKNIGDIDAIRSLRALQTLWLCNMGEISSLKPLRDMSELTSVFLHESTNIVDGDLTPLKTLPKLQKVSFQERKHYNMKRCDFEDRLAG